VEASYTVCKSVRQHMFYKRQMVVVLAVFCMLLHHYRALLSCPVFICTAYAVGLVTDSPVLLIFQHHHRILRSG